MQCTETSAGFSLTDLTVVDFYSSTSISFTTLFSSTSTELQYLPGTPQWCFRLSLVHSESLARIGVELYLGKLRADQRHYRHH